MANSNDDRENSGGFRRPGSIPAHLDDTVRGLHRALGDVRTVARGKPRDTVEDSPADPVEAARALARAEGQTTLVSEESLLVVPTLERGTGIGTNPTTRGQGVPDFTVPGNSLSYPTLGWLRVMDARAVFTYLADREAALIREIRGNIALELSAGQRMPESDRRVFARKNQDAGLEIVEIRQLANMIGLRYHPQGPLVKKGK